MLYIIMTALLIADADTIFSSCGFLYLSSSIFFLAYCQPPQIECLPYFRTWCGFSANLDAALKRAARGSLKVQDAKKVAKNSPSGHHHTTLSGCLFATKACIENRTKPLNSSISPTCRYSMVNFGPLTAEIGSLVCGTPANFSDFTSWQRYCTALYTVSQKRVPP